MRKYIVACLVTLVLGIAAGFIVADSQVKEPATLKEEGDLSKRVQRLEERLEALQEVTHNLVGKRG